MQRIFGLAIRPTRRASERPVEHGTVQCPISSSAVDIEQCGACDRLEGFSEISDGTYVSCRRSSIGFGATTDFCGIAS